MDPTYPLIPIINFLASALVLVPLSTRVVYQAKSIGVLAYAFWVAIMSLQSGINTIVWSNNVNDVSPVWCIIGTHLDIGAKIAIPACSLVITRRLYKAMRTGSSNIFPTRNQKRLAVLIDSTICFGLPILHMGLYYIVQGTTYDILEDFGCATSEIVSGLSFVLIDVWGVIIPLISVLFYCPKIIWTAYHHRREVNAYLNESPAIDRDQCYRIMALGCFDIMITLPFAIANMVNNYLEGHESLIFYPGWSYVHTDWQPVLIPKSEWSSDSYLAFSIRWNETINVVLAVIFFVLFGVTRSSRENYKQIFWAAARIFGFKSRANGQASNIIFGTRDLGSVSFGAEHRVSLPACDIEHVGESPISESSPTESKDLPPIILAPASGNGSHECIFARAEIDLEKGVIDTTSS